MSLRMPSSSRLGVASVWPEAPYSRREAPTIVTLRPDATPPSIGGPVPTVPSVWPQVVIAAPPTHGPVRPRALWSLFVRFVAPYRALAGLIVASLALDGVLTTVVPWAVGKAIDGAVHPSRHGELLWLAVLCGACVTVASILAVCRDYGYARLGADVRRDMQQAMHDRLLQLPLDYHHRHGQGDTLSRFSNDLTVFDDSLSSNLPNVLICTAVVLANVVLLAMVAPWLSLLASVGLALSLGLPRWIAHRATKSGERLRTELASGLSFVQESIQSMRLLHAYARGDERTRAYRGVLSRARIASVDFHFRNNLVGRVPVVGTAVLQVVLFVLGAVLVSRGQLSGGALAAFLLYFGNVVTAVGEMSLSLPALVSAETGAQRLLQLLDEPTAHVGAGEAPPLSREIRFERVRVKRGDKIVLRDVDLTIPCGGLTLIVGSSGSGKSTLLSLLLRFEEPAAGRLCFDGEPLSRYSVASVRSQLGVVFQDNHLLPGTVKDNLRAGLVEEPAADADDVDARLSEAARTAQLEGDLHKLPGGLDTDLRQVMLSGGQQQRVGIARALARKPRLLLMDEGTSALDPVTEDALWAQLLSPEHAWTIVAVTHSLRVAPRARRIVVVHDGQIAAVGTHTELLRTSPHYQRLAARTPRSMPPGPAESLSPPPIVLETHMTIPPITLR